MSDLKKRYYCKQGRYIGHQTTSKQVVRSLAEMDIRKKPFVRSLYRIVQ